MDQFNDRGFGQAFRGTGQSPTYGFSNTYQVPEPQAALGRILDALQDPRMAAFAPGMSLMRAPGMMGNAMRSMPAMTERGSFRLFSDKPAHPLSDSGGFRPDFGQQHFSPITNNLNNDPISWARLLERRHDRYNSMLQEGIADGMSPSQAEVAIRHLNLQPPGLEETENLRFFRRSPANDN